MTDVEALIAEARGFIAGSDPDSARTTLIRDLADALETLSFFGGPSAAARVHLADWRERRLAAEIRMRADKRRGLTTPQWIQDLGNFETGMLESKRGERD